MVHLVTYVLHDRSLFDVFQPPPNYAGVEETVRGISGVYMHIGGGRWFVESQMPSQQIAERLAPLTVVGDQILVFRVHRDWYGFSLTQQQVQWLQARNYSSVWEALAKLAPLPISKPVTAAFSLSGLVGPKR